MESWHKVFEEDKKQRQEELEHRKQEALIRKDNGESLSGDYVYFKESKNSRIAHQDDKIAHPDTMRKEPATILLVIGMIGGLIFKQWYLIWALLLLWYFSKDRV